MAKPNPNDPPGTWHTWDAKPDDAAIAEQVAAFFAAIRDNAPGRAFGVCVHYDFSKPYIAAPTRDTVKQAWKLMAKVLVDHVLVDKADKSWFAALATEAPKLDDRNTVIAKVRLGDRTTPLSALFTLVEHEQRWQLAFHMLRVVA